MGKRLFETQQCVHKETGVRYVRVSQLSRRDIEKLKQYIQVREIEFLMEDLKMCHVPSCVKSLKKDSKKK